MSIQLCVSPSVSVYTKGRTILPLFSIDNTNIGVTWLCMASWHAHQAIAVSWHLYICCILRKEVKHSSSLYLIWHFQPPPLKARTLLHFIQKLYCLDPLPKFSYIKHTYPIIIKIILGWTLLLKQMLRVCNLILTARRWLHKFVTYVVFLSGRFIN